jgi:hypothetical protein
MGPTMRSLPLLTVTYLTSILTGCTTAGDVASSGGVRVGMTKSEVRSALLYTTLAEDPFLNGCRRRYYPDLKLEILAAESETMYFIFEDVYRSTTGCGYDGNGALRYWTSSYEQVMRFVNDARPGRHDRADTEGVVFERPPDV